MPAHPKYLNRNPWHRFAKITAGLVFGYLITALIHMIIAILFPMHIEALITSIATMFIVWVLLLIIPFLFKNGWRALGFYLLLLVILGIIYFLLIPYNPFNNER